MTRLLLAASVASLMGVMPALAQTTRSSEHLSAQDHTFVETAAQGNEAEIQAGQLAETRAATPAVREFGRWMATDHTLMGQMMQAVAQREGVEMPTTPNQTQMQQMSELKNAQGAQFDKLYINAQVQDHEQDVSAFKQEANSGSNPMLKRLAETSLPVLAQHLSEARELQQQTSGSNMASAQQR